MDLKIETAKTAAGLAGAAFIRLFGGNYKLIVLLLIAIIIDTFFGHLKAVHNKDWSSYNARWGMIGKLVELVLVALMELVEWTFNIHWLVNAAVVYFLICEAASIVENIVKGRLNENVPEELADVLDKAQSNVLSALINKVKDLLGGKRSE